MKKTLKITLLITMLLVAILGLTGCGSKKEETVKKDTIIGSWKYDGVDYTYTFNEDGTGNYNVYGTIMEFTYKTEGDKISILYKGNTSPFETTFSIKDDTLNIIDSFGSDTLYKRVK